MSPLPAKLTVPVWSRQVRDALAHLHEPAHLETHPLTEALGSESAAHGTGRGRLLRQLLLDAIEALRPDQVSPGGSRAWRGYQILTARYVEGLDLSTAIAQLAVSRGEFFRDQRQALDAVAIWLYDRSGVAESSHQQISADLASRRCAGLPTHLTTFVGRERDLAAVKELLHHARLITLIGTGGCGKTRLACRVVSEPGNSNVVLVELATLHDATLLAQAVGSALDLGNLPPNATMSALIARLNQQGHLLVLDNCEHLVAACASFVEALLHHCPGVRILATSREPLGLDGEVCWRVPSLAAPDPKYTTDRSASALERYDAIRLFVDRATSRLPDFRLTDENADLVAQICWRLDGIPLAIELAAARVRVLTLGQIADRLSDRFHLLTSGSRTAPTRQRTLRAAVDWSYDLLSPRERTLFNCLSVFVGGFTLTAVENVCADNRKHHAPSIEGRILPDGSRSKIPTEEILDLLASLVDKSLVTLDQETAAGARYHLLETLRHYGWERLSVDGQAEDVRRRHADYYNGLAPHGSAGFHGPMLRAERERLDDEVDNLRASLGWYLEQSDTTHGLALATALYNLWWMRGNAPEAQLWLTRFLTLPGPTEHTMARSRALQYAGRLAYRTGDSIGARAMVEQAIAIAQSLGERQYAVSLSLNLIWILDQRCLLDLVDEYRVFALSPSHLDYEESTFAHLGRYVNDRGNDVAGRAYVEEGLALVRPRQSPYHLAFHLEVLGQIASTDSESEARGYLAEAMALYHQIGDPGGVASVELLLGRLDVLHGHFLSGCHHFRASLELIKDWRWVPLIADALEGLAMAAAATGRTDRALRLAGAATRARRESSQPASPRQQSELQAKLELARLDLEHAVADAVWREGCAMDLEQAIVYGIRDDDGPGKAAGRLR